MSSLRRRRPRRARFGGRLRFRFSNAYARNPHLRAYRRRVRAGRPHVIGVAEAQHVGPLPGYRRIGADPQAPQRRRGVAAYVREDVEVVDWALIKVASRVPGSAYGHDRYAVRVVVRRGAHTWAVYVTHLNPGRRGPVAEANARANRALTHAVVWDRAAGHRVVILADFNRHHDERGRDSPHWLARETGSRLRLAGIDGIIHPRTTRLTRWRAHPLPGSDHPAITGTLHP